ncbi:hypothetical protein AC244_22150 [Ensifer adhaerens]|uniref:Uncharacterized protein n=1 Tax=Ensifer adhaerens TaxID=106592 RepID=A0A0L8BM08_ENSAD|nr:hypothetical protein AC244_22150 [Ensifer adhaerens]
MESSRGTGNGRPRHAAFDQGHMQHFKTATTAVARLKARTAIVLCRTDRRFAPDQQFNCAYAMIEFYDACRLQA